jgi:hypothetical protein
MFGGRYSRIVEIVIMTPPGVMMVITSDMAGAAVPAKVVCAAVEAADNAMAAARNKFFMRELLEVI